MYTTFSFVLSKPCLYAFRNYTVILTVCYIHSFVSRKLCIVTTENCCILLKRVSTMFVTVKILGCDKTTVQGKIWASHILILLAGNQFNTGLPQWRHPCPHFGRSTQACYNTTILHSLNMHSARTAGTALSVTAMSVCRLQVKNLQG